MKVKETILEWSKRVDINSYRKILDYRGNFLVQFLWLLILLASTGATFLLIASSIIDYLKFEVTSQIKIVNELPVQFPTVTFCHNDPFTSKKGEDFLKNISLLYNTTDEAIIFRMAKYLLSKRKPQDKMALSSGFLIECFIGDRDCYNDLHWYWSFQYGNCFQFNSGLNLNNQKNDFLNVTSKGKDNGLEIRVWSMFGLNKYITSGGRGLVVYVHNRTFKPSESVFIQTGTMAYISMKRTFTQKYPKPYRLHRYGFVQVCFV